METAGVRWSSPGDAPAVRRAFGAAMTTTMRLAWVIPAMLVASVGALLLVWSCTADLNDLNTCYALAQAYCKQASTCGAADPNNACISAQYTACPQPKDVRGCLDAISHTPCGQSPGAECDGLVTNIGSGTGGASASGLLVLSPPGLVLAPSQSQQ